MRSSQWKIKASKMSGVPILSRFWYQPRTEPLKKPQCQRHEMHLARYEARFEHQMPTAATPHSHLDRTLPSQGWWETRRSARRTGVEYASTSISLAWFPRRNFKRCDIDVSGPRANCSVLLVVVIHSIFIQRVYHLVSERRSVLAFGVRGVRDFEVLEFACTFPRSLSPSCMAHLKASAAPFIIT